MGPVRGALCTFAAVVILGGGVVLTAAAPPPGPTSGQAVGVEIREQANLRALLELCTTSSDAEVCSALADL